MKITLEQLAQAFELWEKEYRTNPSEFLTPTQTSFLGVSEVSKNRAEYMYSLLQNV
jgi:hypothetical protein